jgi:hypothetical protein
VRKIGCGTKWEILALDSFRTLPRGAISVCAGVISIGLALCHKQLGKNVMPEKKKINERTLQSPRVSAWRCFQVCKTRRKSNRAKQSCGVEEMQIRV